MVVAIETLFFFATVKPITLRVSPAAVALREVSAGFAAGMAAAAFAFDGLGFLRREIFFHRQRCRLRRLMVRRLRVTAPALEAAPLVRSDESTIIQAAVAGETGGCFQRGLGNGVDLLSR